MGHSSSAFSAYRLNAKHLSHMLSRQEYLGHTVKTYRKSSECGTPHFDEEALKQLFVNVFNCN
jgi:hypothetical protein